MPTFTNLELQQRIVPTLESLIRLKLPIAGALRLRTIVNDLRNQLKIVEELRTDTLKSFAKLTEHGEFVTRKDTQGKPTNQVIFKDEDEAFLPPTSADSEAARDFTRFLGELMAQTHECEKTVCIEHLTDDKHPWDSPASLIVNLGDLFTDGESEGTKEKKGGE